MPSYNTINSCYHNPKTLLMQRLNLGMLHNSDHKVFQDFLPKFQFIYFWKSQNAFSPSRLSQMTFGFSGCIKVQSIQNAANSQPVHLSHHLQLWDGGREPFVTSIESSCMLPPCWSHSPEGKWSKVWTPNMSRILGLLLNSCPTEGLSFFM